MAQLLVRDLDKELVEALKRSAASNDRSTEAEHREILRLHLLGSQPPKKDFKEVLYSMPYFNDDDLFEAR